MTPDQRGDDVGLKIGEAEDQIGLQAEDFWNVGRGEGRDASFVAAGFGRSHAIARDADDAILFAEQVQGLDGFFGQADDALRWKQLPTFALPTRLRRAALAIVVIERRSGEFDNGRLLAASP